MDGIEWRTPMPADEQPPFNLLFEGCSQEDLKVSSRSCWTSNPKYCDECKVIEERYKERSPKVGSIVKIDRCIIYNGCLIKINYYPAECPTCHEIYTLYFNYKDGQIGLLIRGGNVINWSVVPCDLSENLYYSHFWNYRTDAHRLFIFDANQYRTDNVYVINREIIDKKHTSPCQYNFELKAGGFIAGFKSAMDWDIIVFVDDSGQILPYDTLANTARQTSNMFKVWPWVYKNEYLKAVINKTGDVEYTSLLPPSKKTKPAAHKLLEKV